jgi:hypothetical protein
LDQNHHVCGDSGQIVAGRLLRRRPGEHERFLAVLGGFEALERLPTRSVTGYFVAVRYTSYA